MELKVVIYNDTNEHEPTIFWRGELIDGKGKVVHRSDRYTDIDRLEEVMELVKELLEKDE